MKENNRSKEQEKKKRGCGCCSGAVLEALVSCAVVISFGYWVFHVVNFTMQPTVNSIFLYSVIGSVVAVGITLGNYVKEGSFLMRMRMPVIYGCLGYLALFLLLYIANYCISSTPDYERTATVVGRNKHHKNHRAHKSHRKQENSWRVTLKFENDETRMLYDHDLYDKLWVTDTVRVVMYDGLLGWPVIKEVALVGTGDYFDDLIKEAKGEKKDEDGAAVNGVDG